MTRHLFEVPDRIGIQGVSAFDHRYGHTSIIWPYFRERECFAARSPPVRRSLGRSEMFRPGSTGSTVTVQAADHYNRSVIAAVQDVMVLTGDDFDRLPDEGIWEVVDGKAVLSPGAEIPHQLVSGALFRAFDQQFRRQETGVVMTTVNVFVPPAEGSIGEIQNRIPDLGRGDSCPEEALPSRAPSGTCDGDSVHSARQCGAHRETR